MSEHLQQLEWTGERFLPWITNATLAYEHLHRYAFAAPFARGKRVLDLGCGEGYGANILAQSALSVLGVDIDGEAIRHASAKYRRDNLKFDTGSFAHVPSSGFSYDLVVCFEAIEHIRDHDELLGEVKRLLKPDGMFMVSTPNKTAYRNESGEDNPYHIHELEPEEFRQLLDRYFRESRFLGQRIHAGSSIWPLEPAHCSPVTPVTPVTTIDELIVERSQSEFEFITNEKRVPTYIIALSSDSVETLSALSPEGSVLIDSSNVLLKSKDAAEAIAYLQNELDFNKHRLEGVKLTVSILESELQAAQIHLRSTKSELEAIYTSTSWNLLSKLWRIHDSLLPQGSMRRRTLQKFMTSVFSRRE